MDGTGATADELSVPEEPFDMANLTLSPLEFELARAWLDLNREALVAYCTGELQYTEDVLRALRPLPV